MSDNHCTCSDSAKRAAQKVRDRKVHQRGRFGVDDEGNQLCTVDSFGFRGAFEGECDACYKLQVAGYNREVGDLDDY